MTRTAATVVRVSADAIPAARRAAFLGDAVSQLLVGARVTPQPGAAVAFDYRIAVLDPLTRLSQCRLVGVDVDRTRHCLADGDDGYSLFIAVAGTMRIAQHDQRRVLARGQAAIVGNTAPVHTGFTACRMISLHLPRSALPEAFARRTGPVPLLRPDRLRYLRAEIAATMRAVARGHVPDLAAERLQALATAACSEDDDRAASAEMLAAARRSALRAVIDRDLADPALSLARAASGIGLGERTAQLAFARAGSSFRAELVAARLEAARQQLGRPGAARVLDVALATGFSDLSYFHRAFRRRFGLPPGEVRAWSLRSCSRDRN